MPVIIREVTSEVVLEGAGETSGAAAEATTSALPEEEKEALVRRAVQEVLERLRREWDL